MAPAQHDNEFVDQKNQDDKEQKVDGLDFAIRREKAVEPVTPAPERAVQPVATLDATGAITLVTHPAMVAADVEIAVALITEIIGSMVLKTALGAHDSDGCDGRRRILSFGLLAHSGADDIERFLLKKRGIVKPGGKLP
jgi:hypothetical protein